MTTATAPAPGTDRWRGGVSPYGLSWQKLMMWWFIISDALLFAGFLAAYGFNRLAAETWPAQDQVFNMTFIAAMTFVLITSSATMASAVAAAQQGDRSTAVKFLLATILGGAVFLGMQAVEWSMIIGHGATLWANPWGPVGFGQFFFLITGFHGTHVLIGVIILLITLLRTKAGKTQAEGVELCGLYWHFVDLVWVFVFGVFYLI